jgi:hypothetical protein
LSKDSYNETAWHKAAKRGHVEVLKKLWDWAKELQLKPEKLRNELLLTKYVYKESLAKRSKNDCGFGLKNCS